MPAGKSTTLGLLTGFIAHPTSGKIYIGGYDKATENHQLLHLVGYCAQVPATHLHLINTSSMLPPPLQLSSYTSE